MGALQSCDFQTSTELSGGNKKEPALTSPSNARQSKTTLYINGTIWTGVADAPDASVMAITSGKISYVGNDSSKIKNPVEVIDLKNQFVTPGLIDNHTHFIEGGAGLAAVQLRDASTPEEFSRRIVDFSKTLAPEEWVLFGNWDHEQWGGELPNKAWIDTQTPNTPVFVMRLDGHMGFANSVALKLAGINSDSEQPTGGEIVRDKNGEPTGVLKDTALEPVLSVIPQASDGELLKAIEAAQNHALRLGLTQVHVMSANPTETNIFRAFKLADQNGLLKIRARVYTPIENWQKALESRPDANYSSKLLSWGGFKGLTDGALGSSTAWFHEPYSDAPDSNGFPLIRPAELGEMVALADQADIKLAIHAIGDKSIDEAISVMRESAGEDIESKRYRIEHFQHPTRLAIKAAADSGIIASMQPYHAIDDGRWAEKRIGENRIKTTYAFRSILEAGGKLSFGSDWPVALLNPLTGIYAAVTRATLDGANPDGWQPQEKISVEQALSAYTLANAYAGFEDNVAGSLEVGKRADFVVFKQDLRKIDANTIPNVAVTMTIIDGKMEYQLFE